MGIIDKSKGYLTDTNTYFGRHGYIFKKLWRELKKEKHSSMSCLIIGPGLENSLTDTSLEFTKTYQPFELANILTRANISDYTIDILDINPDVLNELKKTPTLLNISKLHTYHREVSNDYFQSFFSNNIIKDTPQNRIIKIPENVSSKFNLQLGDITRDSLPNEKYDVVICTVLLSHYYREVTGELYDPISRTLTKIENSIKSKGYLIDSEKYGPDNNWNLIAHHSVESPSIHPESTSLFRKK